MWGFRLPSFERRHEKTRLEIHPQQIKIETLRNIHSFLYLRAKKFEFTLSRRAVIQRIKIMLAEEGHVHFPL